MTKMKSCNNPNCRQANPQPISHFYINKSYKDGLNGKCKSCCLEYQREYARTEQGREVHRKARQKYRESDKGEEAEEKWLSSDSGKRSRKKARRRYSSSLKGRQAKQRYRSGNVGREAHRRAARRHRLRYPLETSARKAVNRAVAAGRLPPIDSQCCVVCGTQANEYHHHKGYSKEHWLDVVSLCYEHHK